MSYGSRVAESSFDTRIELVELSVVLVTRQNDPSILNPDFLRYNEIVDKTLKPSQPPVATPVFSEVAFEGDMNIRAEPNRFVFEQKGQPLDEGECVAPALAERFVKAVSHIPYIAIGINAKSLTMPNEESEYSMADTLFEGTEWMSFRDLRPNVCLKAVYRYESRRITLDVGSESATKESGVTGRGMMFQVNIHRDLGEKNQKQIVKKALSILASWKTDLSDFEDLVTKFHAMGMSR